MGEKRCSPKMLFIITCISYLLIVCTSTLAETLISSDDCVNQNSSSSKRPTCYFSADVSENSCSSSNPIVVWYDWGTDKLSNSSEASREIRCVSESPLEVVVTYQAKTRNVLSSPTKIEYTRTVDNLFDPSTYQYQTRIYFGSTHDRATLVKHYIVQIVDDEDAYVALAPAFYTSSYISELGYALKTNETVEVDKEIIQLPCMAITANYPEGVYKGIYSEKEGNQTATYFPVDNESLTWNVLNGFKLNTSVLASRNVSYDYEGSYFCKSFTTLKNAKHRVLVSKYFQLVRPIDLLVIPNSTDITLHTFSTSKIRLTCSSPHEINIVGDINERNISSNQIKREEYIGGFKLQLTLRNLTIGFSGSVTCQSDGASKNLTHIWNIKVVDLGSHSRQKIWLDRAGKEATCDDGFHTDTARLVNIACNSPTECSGLKTCLRDNYFCGELVKSGQPCDFPWCAKLNPFPNGLLQCGYDTPIIYFTAFNNLLYHHWQEAPKNAVLQLKREDIGDLYTKGTFPFSCRVHTFLSGGEIQWILGYKNGSSLHLKTPTGVMERASSYLQETKRIYIQNSNINQINCLAPVWNSDQWVEIGIPIEVKDSKIPHISSDTFNPKFKIGSKFQTLKCQVESYPKAAINFHSKNLTHAELLSRNFTILKTNDSLSLIFPEITQDLQGEYFCSANNLAGTTTKTYVVSLDFDSEDNTTVIFIIATSICIPVLAMILIATYFKAKWRLNKPKDCKDGLTDTEFKEFLHGANVATGLESYENIDALPYDRQYDICKDTLYIDRCTVLGSGEFGIVYKARLGDRDVAVKSTKPNSSASALKSLLTELKLLMFIGKHENIVEFIGSYIEEVQSGTLYMAMELCELGSLNNYLKRICRNVFVNCNVLSLSNDDECPGYQSVISLPIELEQMDRNEHYFLQWSYEISKAMEYLGQKNIIHSDLATRNILLSADKIAKLSDFGLSRKLYNYTQYVKRNEEPLPWRWMAMESLRDLTFSPASDVWSFGIVLWEIYSFAQVPYPGTNYDVNFLQRLETGLRPGKPDLASSELYTCMKNCWQKNPNNRPSFSSLKEFFAVKSNSQATIDLNLN